MSFETDVDEFAELGVSKSQALRRAPFALAVGGVLAGAYVGVAIILIMTVGGAVPIEVRALAMGASFGPALILIVIAGTELFTGYTMYRHDRDGAGSFDGSPARPCWPW